MATKKIKKMVIVREALKALGNEAKPQAIVEWAQKNHSGSNLSAALVNNYKSKLLRQVAKPRGAKTKARRVSNASGNGNIQAARDFLDAVNKIGVDKAKSLLAAVE